MLTATGDGDRHSLVPEHQLRPLFAFFEAWRDGIHLVLIDRNGPLLKDRVAELESQFAVMAKGLELDLTDERAQAGIYRFVAENFGRLDVLVNNAGLSKGRSLAEITLADWENVLTINLTVPMRLCQALLPFWETGEGGRIVDIGSRVWASGSGPAYTASKAGLVGLTRSLAVQLGRLDVAANLVAPAISIRPLITRRLMRSVQRRVMRT